MRGGISYIAKRHSKASHKNNEANKTIIYLDANNLYGWGMNQLYGGFDWLSEKEINDFSLNSIIENSSIGYFLEVDLEYPSELHEYHNDYPLAPEELEINSDMLSKYCSDITDKYGIKVGGVNKLVPNLRNKKKYVVHYRHLQLYLSLGMKLSKIHRILKFKQSNWLEEYIKFNTKKRKNAVSNFEKNFFKFMINSIYGKTMENSRQRISVRLINDSKDYVRCVSKPNFISQKIFSKNFVAIHQIKSVLILDKPIYVGFSILELSKLLMYKFHYEHVKQKFDAKLLFIDTDSLVYEIKGEDVYEKSFQDKELFDFSEYPVNSRFYDPTNKKILGKMKDEFKGFKEFKEFVGLKSKMYSLISVDDKEVSKAKGVNKTIKHQEFLDVLFNKKVIRHNMNRMQGKLHKIGTYDVQKISLSSFDDKRYVSDDGVNTLAYFHKDLKNS